MEQADPKFVEAYRARNAPDAHLMRNALEEAGIRVRIEGELLQGGIGDLPPGWPTAPRILVEESQMPAARRIIEQLENERKSRADDETDDNEEVDDENEEEEEQTRCLACGAVMKKGETTCRSCGWSYQG